MKGGVFSLWIYAVPVSATCTRLIINAGGNFPKPPPGKLTPAALLQRLSPLPKLLRQLRHAPLYRWHGVPAACIAVAAVGLCMCMHVAGMLWHVFAALCVRRLVAIVSDSAGMN